MELHEPENPREKQDENPDILCIKDTIKNARQRRENEFQISGNTWVQSFASDIHIISGYLQFAEAALSQEEYAKLKGRIDRLNTKVRKLQLEHAASLLTIGEGEVSKNIAQEKKITDSTKPKEPEVSQAVQDQLEKELDIFAADYPEVSENL